MRMNAQTKVDRGNTIEISDSWWEKLNSVPFVSCKCCPLVDIITVHFMQSTKERPYTSSSKHRSQFPKYENASSTISIRQSHCAPSLSETKRSKSRRRILCQHKWGLTTKLQCKAAAVQTSLAIKKFWLAAAVPHFKVRRAWPTQTSSLRLFLGDPLSKSTEWPLNGAIRAKSAANFDY